MVHERMRHETALSHAVPSTSAPACTAPDMVGAVASGIDVVFPAAPGPSTSHRAHHGKETAKQEDATVQEGSPPASICGLPCRFGGGRHIYTRATSAAAP